MAEERLFTLGTNIRSILNNVIEDIYQSDLDKSVEEKKNDILKFLLTDELDEEYLHEYLFNNEIPKSKLKLQMVKDLITSFYEYQSLLIDRNRCTSKMFLHFSFIDDNLDNPNKILEKFYSCKDKEFNRALIDCYILYYGENQTFIYKAIRKQMNCKNYKKLNKINEYYMLDAMSFLNNNQVLEIQEINDELVQIYYDEYGLYFEKFLKEETEIDDDIIVEDVVKEELNLEDYEGMDYDEIEELLYSNQKNESEKITHVSISEEDYITRLTKLRIIQTYINNNKTPLRDIISYMIGNVYENITFDINTLNNIGAAKEEVYRTIDKNPVEELIDLFMRDDDFSAGIISYFVEYNDYYDKIRLETSRKMKMDEKCKEKIKNLNKFYEEENKTIGI